MPEVGVLNGIIHFNEKKKNTTAAIGILLVISPMTYGQNVGFRDASAFGFFPAASGVEKCKGLIETNDSFSAGVDPGTGVITIDSGLTGLKTLICIYFLS